MHPPAPFGVLSVVIPAYNAQAVLAATLADVLAWLNRRGVRGEIIVVDDGSRDATAAIARAAGPEVQCISSRVNRGKGHAVRTGMIASGGDWALFMDADNSTPIAHLDRVVDRLGEGDVYIASRRLTDSRIVRPQHRFRQALGRSFPYLVRALLLPDISDTQCGFKLFSRAAIGPIFGEQRIERFAFDVELLLLARRAGLRIVEFPVDWDNPTQSTLRIGRDAARMFLDVLRMRIRFGRMPGGTASAPLK